MTRIELRTTYRGCECTVARDVEEPAVARLKVLAESDGVSLQQYIEDRIGEPTPDDLIEALTEPWWVRLSAIELAQELFCNAVSLEWSCPWNCEEYEQTVDEFSATLRDWWGYERATEVERRILESAAEAALRHDGAEVRRLVRSVLEPWDLRGARATHERSKE
jgi:hypothetical protein